MFCAEEGDLKTPVDQGSVWVIDPIDGTNNFVAQAEDFAIMVAYFENGQGQIRHYLRCHERCLLPWGRCLSSLL